MLIFVFALPIVVADYSARKIPNIYIIFYSYLCSVSLFVRGFPQINTVVCAVLILTVFALSGVGMGDVKLLLLIILFLQPQSINEVLSIFLMIFAICATEIAITCFVTKAFARTIAMAPSIFIGTGLYLATNSL